MFSYPHRLNPSIVATWKVKWCMFYHYIVPILHIYTFVVSRAFMAGAVSKAGDADSSRAPGLNSGLQGSVNVHRGALLLVPQWQCISSFVFYFFIYDCLYCLHHNLFAYIVSLYWLNQSREINRTTYFNQYRCYHTCDNASMKLIMIWFVHSKFCTPVRARGVKSRMCTSVSPAWS